MTKKERTYANEFISEYINRKQMQGEWEPDDIGLMRVAFGGACEWKNKAINTLLNGLDKIAGDMDQATTDTNSALARELIHDFFKIHGADH